MKIVLRWIVILVRLALLILPIYWIYRAHLVLGLAALVVGYPLWQALVYELLPLRPNWRKAKSGNCYNHSRHELTLTFRSKAAPYLDEVYERLKNLQDFNFNKNGIARRRSEMIRGKKYFYFESLGLLGKMSLLCNPPESPVRVWSRRRDRLVIADTVFGHMLKGQRRWQANPDMNGGIVVSTEAHDRPSNLGNRFGMFAMRRMGADLQDKIWTAYLENIGDHYSKSASSKPVTRSLAGGVVLPAPPQDPEWVPLAQYPAVEI